MRTVRKKNTLSVCYHQRKLLSNLIKKIHRITLSLCRLYDSFLSTLFKLDEVPLSRN
ncbi:ORF9 [Leucania separata nucleopolyhedrovirus]|uniref:ORF9 n=1 Tax=Leucania separata nucleopolyhedrovirus TaxID=1307956 RepID=Q0ILB0_NPVLS|nr:ORF9 [Leucania separata nucleopolyhedrovirus]AAR28773.1 ORF9 [Leucania separata nucleopolyhedrovirus]